MSAVTSKVILFPYLSVGYTGLFGSENSLSCILIRYTHITI